MPFAIQNSNLNAQNGVNNASSNHVIQEIIAFNMAKLPYLYAGKPSVNPPQMLLDRFYDDNYDDFQGGKWALIFDFLGSSTHYQRCQPGRDTLKIFLITSLLRQYSYKKSRLSAAYYQPRTDQDREFHRLDERYEMEMWSAVEDLAIEGVELEPERQLMLYKLDLELTHYHFYCGPKLWKLCVEHNRDALEWFEETVEDLMRVPSANGLAILMRARTTFEETKVGLGPIADVFVKGSNELESYYALERAERECYMDCWGLLMAAMGEPPGF